MKETKLRKPSVWLRAIVACAVAGAGPFLTLAAAALSRRFGRGAGLRQQSDLTI